MTKKTILVTGATDGIGLKTSRQLASLGHRVLLHGRSPEKLEKARQAIREEFPKADLECYVADFSVMADVETLASEITSANQVLDVLINNAGVFAVANPVTADGLDLRFVVNTLAPYLLTRRLLPIIPSDGRVINLSSAAQARVDLAALKGARRLADGEAYAQSKLAITMWSRTLAKRLNGDGPAIIAVNPGSFLGSKMVKEAYGREGKDLSIGSEILTRASLAEEFANATGMYFDNDSGQFASPHPDALDDVRCGELIHVIENLLHH